MRMSLRYWLELQPYRSKGVTGSVATSEAVTGVRMDGIEVTGVGVTGAGVTNPGVTCAAVTCVGVTGPPARRGDIEVLGDEQVDRRRC